MYLSILRELERILAVRNPLLVGKLQDGLPSGQVEKLLKKASVSGRCEPLISLYSWKNGTVLDRELASAERGFFPASGLQFVELDRAIGDFALFKEASINRPEIREAANRYFPVFWDGYTGWLAIDLEPRMTNRVMIIAFGMETPICQGYASFDDFIRDAVKSNKDNRPLACFEV